MPAKPMIALPAEKVSDKTYLKARQLFLRNSDGTRDIVSTATVGSSADNPVTNHTQGGTIKDYVERRTGDHIAAGRTVAAPELQIDQ